MDRTDPARRWPVAALLLTPSVRLMSRLRVPVKFGVVVLALLVPMAFITWQFRDAKQYNADIGVRERNGLVYLTPADRLFALEVQARAAAVRAGDTGQNAADIQRTVGEVQAAVRRHGSEYGNAKTWAAARAALAAAQQRQSSPVAAFQLWNAATAALYADIQQVSGGSTLVLDPQLDTYDLMDVVMNRVLLVMDNSGQAADLATLTAAGRLPDPEHQRIQLAIYVGNVQAPLETIDGELAGAYAATHRGGLRPRLEPLRTRLDRSVAALTGELQRTVAGTPVPADIGARSEQVRQAAAALASQGIPALDVRLDDRVQRFLAEERTVYLVLTAGGLLAAYLLLGTVVSSRRSVRRLVGDLQAAANGDLLRQPAVEGRDEYADMAAALAETLGNVRQSVQAIAERAGNLVQASADLTRVSSDLGVSATSTAEQSAAVASAVHQVSSNSSELGIAAAELSSAIGEIARNAAESARLGESSSAVVDAADASLGALGSASQAIGQVLSLITTIAEQTHLLALNATMEAARAGTAGRGFAVVATEVKSLAQQTADSTAQVRSQVEAMQRSAGQVVDTFHEVRNSIHAMNSSQSVIAAAVEEQTAVTNSMGHVVDQTAGDAAEIADRVVRLATAADATRTSAADVQRAASAVSEVAGDLDAVTRRFRY